VINAVWISIGYLIQLSFFQNPVQPGSCSELQNPVGSRSGNRIIFNAVTLCDPRSLNDKLTLLFELRQDRHISDATGLNRFNIKLSRLENQMSGINIKKTHDLSNLAL